MRLQAMTLTGAGIDGLMRDAVCTGQGTIGCVRVVYEQDVPIREWLQVALRLDFASLFRTCTQAAVSGAHACAPTEARRLV